MQTGLRGENPQALLEHEMRENVRLSSSVLCDVAKNLVHGGVNLLLHTEEKGGVAVLLD